MKALSAKTLVVLALVSLVLTVLFTYLWATLTGTVSTVSSIFVFFTAAIFVLCVNTVDKN